MNASGRMKKRTITLCERCGGWRVDAYDSPCPECSGVGQTVRPGDPSDVSLVFRPGDPVPPTFRWP